ncbi:MAG: DMT family transporter [Kiloniellales bacterium]
MTTETRGAAASSPTGVAGPSGFDYVLLALLGATWGASFFMIKLAVETIPPLTVAAGRILVGAAVLLVIVSLRGAAFPRGAAVWSKLLVMGAIGTVLPFFLINWGEIRIDSGLAAILISAVPLFTIILAHLFQHDEPLSAGNALCVLLGVTGIVILVGPSALQALDGTLLAKLAILGAALCYAGNGIVARRLLGLSSDMVATGMLLTAALVSVPACLAFDQPWQLEPAGHSVLAVVALGIVSTAIGYLLLFKIIARAGAGFSSFNNYLVPLFGVLWGTLLLGEQPHPRALVALAIVFLGLAAPRLLPRLRRARSAR